jgi:endonuclease/exonuclease/phosphatase family metal-dependent hydrolase
MLNPRTTILVVFSVYFFGIQPLFCTDTLRVVSWNIQMLPLRMFSKELRCKQPVRLPWIAEYTRQSDFEVVVFQEVFDNNMRRRLCRKLKKIFPYRVRPRHKLGRLTNSGILVLSRLKMRYLDHVTYKQKKSHDGTASKGCVLVEVEKNGKKVHIAGTHLQAGHNDTYQKIRISQYQDIRKLLDTHQQPQIPQILAGDLNTAPQEPERFKNMLEILDMQVFPINDPRPYTADSTNSWKTQKSHPTLIDFVLLRPLQTSATILQQKILRPHKEYKGKKMDFADHYGVVSDILLP